MNKYNRYFAQHYGYKFNQKDLDHYYRWFNSQWEYILSLIDLNLCKHKPVLEIGSGIGGFYQYLSKYGFTKYIGVEPDKEAYSFAQRNFPKATFHNFTFEKTQQQIFKIIFAFEVLEHLDSPARAINKIYKMTSTNGFFIGTTPYPYVKNIVHDPTHHYVLHPKNWEKLFRESGYRDIKTYPITQLPFFWRIDKKLNVIIPIYLPFDKLVSTTLIIAKK